MSDLTRSEWPQPRIDTTGHTPDEAAQQILLELAALGYLGGPR